MAEEPTAFVDQLIPRILSDRRVWILWLEGDRPEDVRRPFRELDLRIAAMDPDFEALASEIPSLLAAVAPVASCRSEDVPWDGKRYDVVLESGLALRFTLERMSLLGKKSRAQAVPLVDKTGRFRASISRTGRRV